MKKPLPGGAGKGLKRSTGTDRKIAARRRKANVSLGDASELLYAPHPEPQTPEPPRYLTRQAHRYCTLYEEERRYIRGMRREFVEARLKALRAVYPPHDGRIDACRDALREARRWAK